MARPRDVRPMRPARRQRGWVGLVVLLVALAIVGWLALGALKGYGLSGKPAGGATSKVVPADPRERARAAEAVVLERAREAARRDEEAERSE